MTTTIAQRRRLTALRAAWLFDGASSTLTANPMVLLDGGSILAVGAATGVAGVRAAVREHAEHGAEVIKIMASGGNLTPGSHPELPQFGAAELQAAVDEAHRLSLPITAHAHGTPAIAAAVAAGVD